MSVVPHSGHSPDPRLQDSRCAHRERKQTYSNAPTYERVKDAIATGGVIPSPTASSTVLVADDEEHIVDFLALLLEDEGCRVLRAVDGLQAWELSERYRPHVIISDVMMPGMTGVELALRIKRTYNGSSPRIVLMSAATEISAMPGVQFLRKPFDIDEILELIALGDRDREPRWFRLAERS